MPAYAYGPGLLSISHGPKSSWTRTASSSARRSTHASRRPCSRSGHERRPQGRPAVAPPQSAASPRSPCCCSASPAAPRPRVYAIVPGCARRAIAARERGPHRGDSECPAQASSTPCVEVGLGEVRRLARHRGSVWSRSGVRIGERTDHPHRARPPNTRIVELGVVHVLRRRRRSTVARPDPRRQDESGDAPRAAVISDGLWKRLFGADARFCGSHGADARGVAAPPQLIEIVGVMPAGFDFPRDVDVWLPAAPILRSSRVTSPATGRAMSRGTSPLQGVLRTRALARRHLGDGSRAGAESHHASAGDSTGMPSGVT